MHRVCLTWSSFVFLEFIIVITQESSKSLQPCYAANYNQSGAVGCWEQLVQQLSSVSDHRAAPHEQLEVEHLADGYACRSY